MKPRRVVFFGDGQFSSSMRGNPPMPKKRLLKLLATRTHDPPRRVSHFKDVSMWAGRTQRLQK